MYLRYNLSTRLEHIDEGHKQMPLQPIEVQIVRWAIRSEDNYHSSLNE